MTTADTAFEVLDALGSKEAVTRALGVHQFGAENTTGQARSFTLPVLEKIYHRLLEIGHSHRRAVLLMWLWAGLVAFGGVLASLYAGRVTTVVLAVWVAFTARGLTMIHAGGSEEEFRARYAERCGREVEPEALPEKLRTQVAAALAGEGVRKPAVDLYAATDFERDVLEILTRIPRGEVRTYSWVAQQAGRPSAIRAVGNICAKNVVPFVVPCHRVVPTIGGVGNYAFGERMKRKLLEREGVPVKELEELARQHIRFTGSKTTKIFCNPTCRDAKRTRDQNRVLFHDADEAYQKGYRPCKRCLPVAA